MSIARIAEAANVSYATAWRILNKRFTGNEDSVEAVHRAVRQIGYAPTPTTNGPRRGRPSKIIDGIRTRSVALLHLRPGTSLSKSILGEVNRMLAERDLNLIFAEVSDVSMLPHAVRTGNVDGILGYGRFPDDAISPLIERIPAVWMMSRNDRRPDRFGDRVSPDHHGIGQIAAEYLLSKNIIHAAVLNPCPKSEIYRQRCEAFAAAMEDGSAVVDRLDGTNGELNAEVAGMVERWLGTPKADRAKAIFVPADQVVLPLHKELERRGIDLSPKTGVTLISSDNDTEILRQLTPRPVTMDLGHQAIAQLAVERLFWRMRHGMSVPQMTLNVRPRLIDPAKHDTTSAPGEMPGVDG